MNFSTARFLLLLSRSQHCFFKKIILIGKFYICESEFYFGKKIPRASSCKIDQYCKLLLVLASPSIPKILLDDLFPRKKSQFY